MPKVTRPRAAFAHSRDAFCVAYGGALDADEPAIFSKDAAGKPILGDFGVNSDIDWQWTRGGLAASLRDEA